MKTFEEWLKTEELDFPLNHPTMIGAMKRGWNAAMAERQKPLTDDEMLAWNGRALQIAEQQRAEPAPVKESLTTEQPEDESAATVRAERDALRAESAELRERVRELEADARRWHFVRQFMLLDDVGDEDFCLGLITYGESLSERVDPAAQRLYKDRWDARCRAEYRGEELDQGEITVDEAIDAAMQEGE